MHWYDQIGKIEDMVGKTFTSIENKGDELLFHCEEGTFRFFHDQDCCESVCIDDIVGDLDDLVGTPLLSAEEVSNSGLSAKSQYEDSFTWTFYKFATVKGYVDVKWYGSSNGYYSESVNLEFIKK